METKIYVIRHAEAEGNKYRIFHGSSDSELTENGRVQAKNAAKALKKYLIEKIYSSNLKRAYDTAVYFSEISGLDIIVRSGLSEIHGGLWENETWKALENKFPNEYDTWENMPHLHKMPKGESMEDFRKRVISEFDIIARQNTGRTISVFTHGTFIRVLLSELTGVGFENLHKVQWHENTAITKIIYNADYEIEFDGIYDHLEPSQATVLNQGWDKKEKKDDAST